MEVKIMNKINEKDVLEYNKKINILATIKNCITLICFTILAIVFNKWWIVLFSALFVVSVGKKNRSDDNEKD
jgi:hypothetical protein